MGLTIVIVAVSIAFSIGIAVFVMKQAGVLGPRKRVLASGEQGQATIMGVAPTGTVINEINYVCKFQLRVSVPGRETYDVDTKESVPITAMGAIVPGTVVGVRVDPKDPTAVFIDWSVGITPAGGAAAASQTPPSTGDLATALHDPAAAAHIQRGSAADLLRTGQPATGVLKSFADTGNTPRSLGNPVAPEAMDDPLFVMTVDLQFAPGTPPIEGTVVHRVPRAIAPTLRIGMPLTCAVDPGNPTRRFAINWDAAAPGQQQYPSTSAPSASHN
jgi:hypothetical protein